MQKMPCCLTAAPHGATNVRVCLIVWWKTRARRKQSRAQEKALWNQTDASGAAVSWKQSTCHLPPSRIPLGPSMVFDV